MRSTIEVRDVRDNAEATELSGLGDDVSLRPS